MEDKQYDFWISHIHLYIFYISNKVHKNSYNVDQDL